LDKNISQQKLAEEFLKKNEKLERFNKLAPDRELKVIELKKEVSTLLGELEKRPKYKIVGES
jgi:hypothetical protein